MAAINMNQEQFKQAIREEKPVLVDFWAPWCGYAAVLPRVFREDRGAVRRRPSAVGKINFDEEEPQLSSAVGIETIPL